MAGKSALKIIDRPVAPPPIPPAGITHATQPNAYRNMPMVIRRYSLKPMATFENDKFIT
jgi:hypothetical protein